MSDYDTLESSLESSRPIEVYQIVLGGTTYLYTSAEDEVTVGVDVYLPRAIARSEIQQGGDASGRSLLITLPSDDEFAAQYVNIVPGQNASVTIIRLQRDESPFGTQSLQFKGVVESVRYPNDGHVAEVSCRSIETASNTQAPRYTYSGVCNHILYGPGCQADPNLHTHTGTVTAVSGNTITLSGAAASGHDFVGGYCRPTGQNDFRLILAQSGDVLTLLLPFASNVLTLSVQAFAGCDHAVSGDCAQVFDNVQNFGGFAWVPKRNPFDGLEIDV